MAKELLLYSGIYDWVAETLISQIEENASNEIILRMNTPGGLVFAGWGIVAKMKEHGNIRIKVDGAVMSMGTVIVAFCDDVEALDISTFMLHRADMYVGNEQDQLFLDGVNKDLQAKLKAKIDSVKLKEITGYTVDDLFSADTRIDLFLTAKQAKQVGLVNRIVKLNPNDVKAFHEGIFNIAASGVIPETKPIEKQIPIKMTLDKLKAEHPELYAQLIAMGTKAEQDRVASWMAYNEIDAAAVAAGIKGGEAITEAARSEFHVKSFKAQTLAKIEGAAPETVATTETAAAGKTDKENTLTAFEAAIDAKFKTGPKA